VRYRHTQFGWVTLGASVFIFPVLGAGLWKSDPATLVLVAVIVGVIAMLFGWLTVDIDDGRLLVRMGIGLIRRSIPQRDAFVVVNFKDATRTRELYRELTGLTGRQKTGGRVP
jgi:hypothetical protein